MQKFHTLSNQKSENTYNISKIFYLVLKTSNFRYNKTNEILSLTVKFSNLMQNPTVRIHVSIYKITRINYVENTKSI